MARLWAYLMLAGSALFWSGNFVIGRAFATDIAPITISYLRWCLALLLVLPFTLMPMWKQRGLIRSNLPLLVFMGAVGVAGFNSFAYLGLNKTTATNALLINSFIPILIILLSRIIPGTRITPGKLLGIAVSTLGVLLLVADLTETLRKRRELESTMSLLNEVHHRVKNNLQMIASIMSMEARRAQTEEARTLMEESANRILSVAVVHEYLSHNSEGVINLQEIASRVVGQLRQGLVDPLKQIEMRLIGPPIWLPTDRATQCALMVNELIQNAIVHGMNGREQGRIEVELVDSGDEVTIVVSDDGWGLSEGFDLAKDSHLGLTIVRSMAERDLRGQFSLVSDGGTRAIVRFNKTMIGGT